MRARINHRTEEVKSWLAIVERTVPTWGNADLRQDLIDIGRDLVAMGPTDADADRYHELVRRFDLLCLAENVG